MALTRAGWILLLGLLTAADGGEPTPEISPATFARFAPLKRRPVREVTATEAECLSIAWPIVRGDDAWASSERAKLVLRAVADGDLCMVSANIQDSQVTGGGEHYFFQAGKLLGRMHGK